MASAITDKATIKETVAEKDIAREMENAMETDVSTGMDGKTVISKEAEESKGNYNITMIN
jgi:hypothetical protein